MADLESSFNAARRAVKDEDFSVTGEAWPKLSLLPPGTKFPVGRHELGVQNFHRNIRRIVHGEQDDASPIQVAAE